MFSENAFESLANTILQHRSSTFAPSITILTQTTESEIQKVIHNKIQDVLSESSCVRLYATIGNFTETFYGPTALKGADAIAHWATSVISKKAANLSGFALSIANLSNPHWYDFFFLINR